MNQSLHLDPSQRRIIDLVPLLMELCRTEDRSVLADAQLPNAWDFGALWQHWDHAVRGWETSKVADLIKGLTYYERIFRKDER